MRDMKKPIIGISGSMMQDVSVPYPGYKRSYANDDYVQSVVRAGGIPLIIPFCADDAVVREQMALVDALLLTGGDDVYPLHYGEEPLQGIESVWPERDHFDFILLEEAEKKQRPIFATCRGHQIVNVFHGGSLYQDLKYDKQCSLKHSQDQRPDLGTHTIRIEEDSLLGRITGLTELVTNTHHHQSVKAIAPGLEVTAVAKDGTIEAIGSSTYPWLLSVQFHPEAMTVSTKACRDMFTAFIAATIEYKEK